MKIVNLTLLFFLLITYFGFIKSFFSVKFYSITGTEYTLSGIDKNRKIREIKGLIMESVYQDNKDVGWVIILNSSNEFLKDDYTVDYYKIKEGDIFIFRPVFLIED